MKTYNIGWRIDSNSPKNLAVFTALAQAKTLKVSGLLFSKIFDPFYRYKKEGSKLEIIESNNDFFHQVFNHKNFLLRRLLLALKLNKLVEVFTTAYQLFPLDSLYNEVIWRNYFANQVSASDRKILSHVPFFFTNMSPTSCGKLQNNFDYVVFSNFNKISLPSNVKKIVYLCDQSNLVINKHCSANDYIVCDSEKMAIQVKTLLPMSKHKIVLIQEELDLKKIILKWEEIFSLIHDGGI